MFVIKKLLKKKIAIVLEFASKNINKPLFYIPDIRNNKYDNIVYY